MKELVVTYRGVVYPWQCDQVGHLNVMYYVGKFDEASWQFFGMLGITHTYLEEQKRGMGAVDQRITYKREQKAGAVVSVRTGCLEVREKVIRFYHEMRNDITGEVAATTELTAVHFDAELRKSCLIPREIADRARGMIVEPRPA